MNAKKTDHVTPLLYHSNTGFNTRSWYVFKAAYRMVQEYIAELIKPYNSGLMLRSSSKKKKKKNS